MKVEWIWPWLIAVMTFCLVTVLGADSLQGVVNHVTEWSLKSVKKYSDPLNDVELDVVVTSQDGKVYRVPAFWAGEQTWRVRFASTQPGLYTFRTECSDTGNSVLHGATGTLLLAPYTGTNLLYRHGPIRVSANRKHFEHADGTPFFWLADTWWMGFCKRLHWPDEFKTLTADRTSKGFNVIQIVAGLYPDMPAFDERGANEAGFPWSQDYSRINPAYFEAADRRVAWMVDAGLAPCIVGAWGYHLPWLGVERMKKHWRYLVARWSAYPVVWCVAGEGIMPYYLSNQKDEDRVLQKKGWTEVANYLRKLDPYHRPITIHPTDMSRGQVEDPNALDFEMLQTGHSDRASIPNTINLVRASRAGSPAMPTINSEVCYEGIGGTCFDDVQRFMVWSCLLSGTGGHTYGANGIWQVNRREQPYGKSPHGGNWGNTPWDEAMRLPGSRQTGLAKQFLQTFEWHRFEPYPEWASWTTTNRLTPIKWGDWIWFPEGDPAKDAPVEQARFFRRSFDLPADATVKKAALRLTADDKLIAFLNGERLGSHSNWRAHREFNVLSKLRRGKNVLAVEAENLKSPVTANPSGLLCNLEIFFGERTTDSSLSKNKIEIVSNSEWRVSQKEEPGWTSADFSDDGWPHAVIAAKYGDGPWKELNVPAVDAFMIPYAAGIPSRVRVIYLPMSDLVTVHHLEPEVKYRAKYFSPITGETSSAGTATATAEGSWAAPFPPGDLQDWVLVLEK